MNKTDGKMALTAFQLASSLVGVMVSLGPLFISRIATYHVGRDAWIVLLLASLVMLLNTYVMIQLAKRFPDQTFGEYSQVVFGKWIGRIIGLFQLLLGIILSGLTLWYTAKVINTFILFQTPSYVITLCLLLLSFYACSKGLSVIGRVTEIIFILSFGFFLFFIPPVVEYGHLSFLWPIGTHFGLSWLHGIWALLFCFAGYEMFLTFYPFLKQQERPKITKHMIGHMGYVAIIFVVAVFTQQLVYPFDYMQKLWLPSIHYVSLVKLPIFERSDLIFILFWFCVFFKSNMVYFYRTVIEAQLFFKLKTQKWAMVVIAGLIYAVSFIHENPQVMEKRLMFVMHITVIAFLILPICSLILVKLRRSV